MKYPLFKFYLNYLLVLTIYIEARNKFKISPIDLDIYNTFNLTLFQSGFLLVILILTFQTFKIDDFYLLLSFFTLVSLIYFINLKFIDYKKLKKLTNYIIYNRKIDLNEYLTFLTIITIALILISGLILIFLS